MSKSTHNNPLHRTESPPAGLQKNMYIKFIMWIIAAAVSGLIGNYTYSYIQHLLKEKDSEIFQLMKQVNLLEKKVFESKQLLSTIDGEVKNVSDGVSILSSITPEKQLQALQESQKYIERLSIVRNWSTKTKLEITAVSEYERYASQVPKDIVLNSMKSICTLYSFHLWFTEENILNLPKPVIIEFAEFFNSIENNCVRIPENIVRIQQDSWSFDLVYTLSGQVMISYPMIMERYDSVMRSTKQMLRLISEERRRLQ